MKRKLNMVLSLLLVVVMVFPATAVSAAIPAAQTLTATLNGNFVVSESAEGVYVNQTLQLDSTSASEKNVILAKGATATLQITGMPEGAVLDYQPVTSNGAVALVFDKETGKADITTLTVGKSDTFKFVATAGGQAYTLTVTFSVVANKILDLHVFRKDGTSSVEITGAEAYALKETIEITSVKADYLDGRTAEVASYSVRVYNPQKATAEQWISYEGSVITAFGGDTKMEITAKGDGGLTYTKEYGMDVNGNTVTKVEVVKADGATSLGGADASHAELLKRINVLATMYSYTNPFVYTNEDYDEDWTITYYEDAQGTKVRGDNSTVKFIDSYFRVTVEGTKSALYRVSDFVSLTTVTVTLVPSSTAKKSYFIGESFNAAGYKIKITESLVGFNKEETKELSSCQFTVDSDKYNNTSKAFTGAMTNSDLKLNVTFTYGGKSYTETLVLAGVTVTTRPTLSSITATTTKVQYMTGETPMLKHFIITALYSDGSTRRFVVEEDSAYATLSSATFTKDGVTYTVRITPAALEATTDRLTVTYSEKPTGSTTTTTKSAVVPVVVTAPACVVTYYTGYSTPSVEVFANFTEALNFIETLSNSNVLYATTVRPVQIKLYKDVAMTSNYASTVSMEVDLNGYSLTMIQGKLYVYAGAASTTQIAFKNTAAAAGKLVYSNSDADNIVLATTNTSGANVYKIDRTSTGNGKFAVTKTVGSNGKMTGPTEVAYGNDAKFVITPNNNYKIDSIKVDGKAVDIPSDGNLTVKNVQAALKIEVTFVSNAWNNPFSDVYKTSTYYEAVRFVYDNNLFKGTSATTFEPNTYMTRAMFVTVLGRLAGIDEDTAAANYGYTSVFADVSADDLSIKYAIPYIKWASENGLIEGYGDGNFGPKDNITHAQMYVLMQRYASMIAQKSVSASGTAITASDKNQIPDWAYEAVEYATKYSFTITSSSKLTPNTNAKRAELAVLLQRFCDNVLEWNNK